MPDTTSTLTGAPCWIDLFSSDTGASRAFYTGLFGWTADDPSEAFGGYINFRRDGAPVAGCMHDDGTSGTPDRWSVYLHTADAAATVTATAATDGQVILPVHPVGDLGTMAMVGDPGGAAVGAWQPGSHAGFGSVGEPGTPAWFELHTPEFDASVAFYRDVFGWDLHAATDVPGIRYATLGDGAGNAKRAGIMDATDMLPDGVPASWSIYFAVDDTDAAAARAVELGGSIVMAPLDSPFGRLAQLADPTGASFKVVHGL